MATRVAAVRVLSRRTLGAPRRPRIHARSSPPLLSSPTFDRLPGLPLSSLSIASSSPPPNVYLGLGTNLGDRQQNIAEAVRRVSMLPDTKLAGSSFLYESVPAHITDQPLFLNAALRILTILEPHVLMHRLQEIEDSMGRDRKMIRYGPRLIDIDILIYGNRILDSPSLKIPHPMMTERPFVLQPLVDLEPTLLHPGKMMTVEEIYQSHGYDPTLRRVLPTPKGVIRLDTRTHVMGIINCTPDSFSDGGQFYKKEAAVEHAKQLIEQGADILDLGGQSTRPGAKMVSAEEEAARITPVVEALRKESGFDRFPISVDTFRSSVAVEAVRAGADIVNDVSGGTLDATMIEAVAALKVPYILMHMRGDPSTMQSEENTSYSDVVAEVRNTLRKQVQLAESSGILRWNLICDPGIGFAKKPVHNFRLMRELADTAPFGIPILSGPSRKSFIIAALKAREGLVLETFSRNRMEDIEKAESNKRPSEKILPEAAVSLPAHANGGHPRAWGTAAAVTASVAGGASIVRVHDVREMVDVVAVADAIYRK